MRSCLVPMCALFVALLSACGVRPEAIEPPSRAFYPYAEHAYPAVFDADKTWAERKLTIVFEDISAADFKAMGKPKSPLARALAQTTQRLNGPSLVNGKRQMLIVLLYCVTSGVQNNLCLHHDPKTRRVLLHLKVIIARRAVARYSDEAFLAAILSSGPYVFEAMHVHYGFAARGRGMTAAASGKVIIELVQDASAALVVGGLRTQTDAQGRFRFEGRPSMARVTEGIIVLIDEAGRKIEARQDDRGRWGVTIQGQRSGQPYSRILVLEQLGR